MFLAVVLLVNVGGGDLSQTLRYRRYPDFAGNLAEKSSSNFQPSHLINRHLHALGF